MLNSALGWLACAALGGLAGLTACTDKDRALDEHDNIYYAGALEPFVLCGSDIDEKYGISDAELDAALARAQHHGHTLHLYAHDPGVSISIDSIEHLLMTATDRGMPFVTYRALGTGGSHGSVALSFDDHSVADWTAIRPLLAKYDAHVTFFVSGYLAMSDDEHAQLHQLEADGHDVEFHSKTHQNAVVYAAAHGVDGYVADEILPALDAMLGDGFEITQFAYPFGARNAALDAALAPYFTHVRAIHSTCPRR